MSRPSPDQTKSPPDLKVSPEPVVSLPGFRRLPEGEDPPPPTPNPALTPPRPPSSNDGGAAAEMPDLDESATGPTPARPTRPRFKLGGFKLRVGRVSEETKEELTKFFGVGLAVLGSLLHRRLTPDAKFGPNEVWQVDEGDVENIAGPVASIIGRRSPTGLAGDSDVADLLQLTTGVGGYVIANGQKHLQLRSAAGGFGPAEFGDPVGSSAGPAASGDQ